MSEATVKHESQSEDQGSGETSMPDFHHGHCGSVQLMQQVNGFHRHGCQNRFFKKRKIRKSNYKPSDAERGQLGADAIRIGFGFDGTRSKIFLGPYPDESAARERFMRAFGSGNFEFCLVLLEQLAAIASQGNVFDEQTTNRMLSIITLFKPKSQSDAMLAGHVAAANELAMIAALRFASTKDSKQATSAERAYNNFIRTLVYLIDRFRRRHIAGERPAQQQRISITVDTQATGNIAESQTPVVNDAQVQTPGVGQTLRESLEKPQPAPPILMLTDANGLSMPLVVDSEHAAVSHVPRRRL